MHNLIRFYYENRIKVWTAILAIIFIFVLIQLLNSFSKQQKTERQSQQNTEETTSNVVSYDDESKTIMSGEEVPSIYKDDFGKLIDEFYTYCINHQPDKAYELLSADMKNIKYKSIDIFKELYYNSLFEGNKQYSFQSWSQSNDIYIYQVRVFDDMLSTGKSNEQGYKEDYITIVPEEDEYKLNIDSYIGRKQIYKEASNDILQISAQIADIYMNYEIYTFNVKNNTDEKVILDTRDNTKTAFLVDSLGNNFYSFLYENKKSDLILEPQEMKTIEIKFNDSYRDNIEIKEINFEDIVKYEEYQKNTDIEGNTLKIEL